MYEYEYEYEYELVDAESAQVFTRSVPDLIPGVQLPLGNANKHTSIYYFVNNRWINCNSLVGM